MAVRLPLSVFPLLYAAIIGTGLIASLILAMRLHLSSIVQTHCKQPEYWPSISSTTGDFMPERGVWRICICFCLIPRTLSSFGVFFRYRGYVAKAPTTVNVACLFGSAIADAVRIASATMWTYVASFENLGTHHAAFATYILSGFLLQLFQVRLASLNQSPGASHTAYTLKKVGLGGQTASVVGFLYFFLVHHLQMCLPGGYSRASICEWSFAVFNVFFDASQTYDLRGMTVALGAIKVHSDEDEEDREDPDAPARSVAVCVSEVWLSGLQWAYVMALYQNVYFIPMVAMKFTSEVAMALAPATPMVLAVPALRNLLRSRVAILVLHVLTVFGLFNFDVERTPETKLLIVGVGEAALSLSVYSRLLLTDNTTKAHRFRIMTAFPLGLGLCMLFRVWGVGTDPVFATAIGNVAGVFLTIAAAAVIFQASAPQQNTSLTQQLEDSAVSNATFEPSPVSVGVCLGLLQILCASLLTAPTVLSRFTGMPPFGPGLVVIVTVVAGALWACGNGRAKPPVPLHWLLVLGVTLLYYGTTQSMVMVDVGVRRWQINPYRGWPVLAFSGGLIVAFCLSALWLPVTGLVIASALPSHGGSPVKVFGFAFLLSLIILLANVYTCTFPFVPGGFVLRNRSDIVLIGSCTLFAVLFHKLTASAANAPRPSGSAAARSLSIVGVGLVVLMLFVAGARHITAPTVGFGAEMKGKGTSPLTTAIWTIHFGLDNYGNDSFERLTEELRKTEATVIGMLETDISRPMNGNRDIVEYVAHHLGMYADFGPATLDNTFGCALFSKYPIVRADRLVTPSPMGELACHIHAWLDVYGTELQVHVAHFGNTDHWLDRELQAETLRDRMVENPNGPAIFLGYMTTKPGGPNYHTVVNNGTHNQLFKDTAKTIVDDNLFEEVPTKGFKMKNSGRIQERNPNVEYADRYCQYVLYRALEFYDWYKISAGDLSDTEIQVGQFKLPS